MKIGLYISDILLRTGGTEANCSYIIYALQKIYNFPEITVISEKYRDTGVNITDIAGHLNSTFGLNIKPAGTHLLLLAADKSNFIGRMLFERKIRRASKKFDFFFNCSMNLFNFAAKKNVVIIHFPPYRKTKSPFVQKYPWAYFAAALKDRSFLKTYSLYISYSQYVRYWLDRIWGIDEARAALIDPAVNPVTKTDKKSDVIFVCSRIEKSKDIDILVSAFQASELLQKTCKLIIAGAVIAETKSYVETLKNLIGSQTGFITLHENPSHEEIETYYSRAKIFWHAKGYSIDEENDPFELEHFGLTTVEAMSAGCVPVVINKGGQKEIIEDGVNGYRWDTPEQLIEKTVYLMQHEDEREKMSAHAMEKAKHYSLDNFTENLGKVLIEKLGVR